MGVGPGAPGSQYLLFKRHFFTIRGGRFVDAYLTTEKKPLAKKSPFHDESLARKSKILEQSGGGGGSGCDDQLKF